MQTCSKCKSQKPHSEYYKSSKTVCKPCCLEKCAEYREKNREKVRAHDRERNNTDARRKDRRDRNRRKYENPEFRASETARHKRNVEKHPIRHSAVWAANNAQKAGKLHKEPCQRCGQVDNVQAHHEDYSKPLDVVWLCPKHHGERHREINEHRRHAEN